MMRDLVVRMAHWLAREHWLIGASLARISLGSWGFYYLILHWPVRHTLYGPDGVWPFERFIEAVTFVNVFRLSPSPIYFEVIYHMGLAVSFAYALGLWTRVMGVLQWVMIWSIHDRNPLVTDGGDNIMRIVLLFLILVNTSAHFSLDGARRARPHHAIFGRVRAVLGDVLRPCLAVVHNFGIILILLQLVMLYMSTGLYKVMGEVWQNGTALYYILRVDEYSWPGVAETFYRSPYLVVGGTYGTIFFETMFGPSLLWRWTRYLAIGAGFFFHLGIALLMGLITFGWSMLSYYPLLVTDREYGSLTAWLRKRLRLTVFYDGWCRFCVRNVRWLERFDLFSLVEFISFREPGVAGLYALDPQKLERRIQSVGGAAKRAEGMTTMIHIALRSPLLWSFLPFLLVCDLVSGQRAYDAIASRRFVLFPGGCEGHCPLEESRNARG